MNNDIDNMDNNIDNIDNIDNNINNNMVEQELFDISDPIDIEFAKGAYKLDDENGDIAFPKATVDPRLLKLQKESTEFITSVILKHEREFYQLVEKNFPSQLSIILGQTRSHVIEMITQTTNKFFNQVYRDIQHGVDSGSARAINKICQFADYAPHILLDKLMRITLDVHLDIPREKLIFDDNNYETYEQSVLTYLNLNLLSYNLLNDLDKNDNDEGDFVNVPDNKNAFDIIIDKNIQD